MIRGARAAVVILAACGTRTAAPSPPQTPPGPTTADQVAALWSRAPANAELGVVVAGDALALADRALTRYRAMAAIVPQGQDLVTMIDAARRRLLGTAADPAAAGVELERGGAVFRTAAGTVAILPVADRARFVAAHGGRTEGDVDRIADLQCRPIDTVYACATAVELLAAVGTGDLGAAAGVGGHRGNIELVARAPAADASVPELIEITGPLTMVAELRPGELVVRGRVPGTPRGPLAALAAVPRASLALDNVAGFVVAPPGALWRAMPELTGGAARPLILSIAGAATVVVPTGAVELDGRAALTDPEPARALLARCGRPGSIPGTIVDGACRVGPVAAFPSASGIDVWLDGSELRAGRKGAPARATGTSSPSAHARELAAYPIASWGHGVYARLAGLSELGLGIDATADGVSVLVVARTIHANPDVVATRLLAAIEAGGDVAGGFRTVAAEFPDAPIAADVAAGESALAVPIMGFGMVLSVAIPALFQHARVAHRAADDPEAHLTAVGETAKQYYAAHGQFPVGTAGGTPTGDCCDQAGAVCPADAAQWTGDPMWTALGLRIDEPQHYRYAYKGSPQKFTLKAYADLDCDRQGTTEVWLQGRVDHGQPVVEISRSVDRD